MNDRLVSVDEVVARLPWEFVDDRIRRIVSGAIEDASTLARFYGLESWTADKCPPIVKTQVRNACVRYMLLAEGVISSRAGDDSESYTDLRDRTGTVFFREDEQAQIQTAAGRGGNFMSIDTYRHSPERATGERVELIVWPLGRPTVLRGYR